MVTRARTNVDVQRILAIMDELKEKLTFLSVATPQVLAGLQTEDGQATQDILGPELMRQFDQQIRLEELYQVATTASDESFGAAEDSEEAQRDQKILAKSTLELCRRMRAVPNIYAELKAIQDQKPGQVINFMKTLAAMQVLTNKRLTTTGEEDRSRQELLSHYQSRANEAQKRLQQLNMDLGLVRSESEKQQNNRQDVLTKLKAELFSVRESSLDHMNQLRTHYETRMTEHQEAFDAKREDLEKKIAALKEANTKARATSQDAEKDKKKQTKRYETEVDEKIRLYDKDVKEMAYILSDHQEGFKQEQRQLNELREHFEKVDDEKACIAAEEAITQARQAKLEAERDRCMKSAALVQAYWRGIIERERYTQMKKAKKKKGGKKKK